jgi:hypothetical protein
MKLVHVFAGSLVLFAGCSQGEGDRCQTESDCASGLTCVGATNNMVCKPKGFIGGTAGTTGQTSSTPHEDAGTKADAATDATVDVATAPADATDNDSALAVDSGVKPADASADIPALAMEAGSDRVSVVVKVDTAINTSADAEDVAAIIDAAIDSAMPGNDVATDADALLMD